MTDEYITLTPRGRALLTLANEIDKRTLQILNDRNRTREVLTAFAADVLRIDKGQATST
jgi:16S rRNA A1518/A1519 N6-dimethyltransferase RsmA/KsgA/DIM1 with predicted DNA glycosylase/AP lyase activity